MSRMIQCDGCKKNMYADSRSDKGDYHEMWIDQKDVYHVCRECYSAMMRNIFHLVWSEDNCQWEERERKCKNCKWFKQLKQDGISIDWCTHPNKQGAVAPLWSCNDWKEKD